MSSEQMLPLPLITTPISDDRLQQLVTDPLLGSRTLPPMPLGERRIDWHCENGTAKRVCRTDGIRQRILELAEHRHGVQFATTAVAGSHDPVSGIWVDANHTNPDGTPQL